MAQMSTIERLAVRGAMCGARVLIQGPANTSLREAAPLPARGMRPQSICTAPGAATAQEAA